MAETPQQLSLRPTLATLLDAHRWGVLVGGAWNQVSPTTMKTFVGLGPMTFTIDGVDEAIVDGTDDVLVTNTSAAALGAQQYSPAIRQLGSGWETDVGSSMIVEYRTYVQTVQGSAAPSALWVMESSINGGGYTQHISIGSDSAVIFAGVVSASNLSGSNTGDQTITLTGGVTGSGTGSFAATVITNANLTGHITSTGNAAILGSFTIAQLSTALSDASISGNNTGDQTITLTGGVTGSGTGSFAATVITNANLTGHITSAGNAAILGSFTVAQLSTALSDVSISGTNTGDQTSIVGISGTKAQFNTAVSDGSIMFVGDPPTAHTHPASDITAGTFGTGAYVFDNTVSGITTLTATTLAGTLSTATQNSVTTMTGLISVGALGSGSISSAFGNVDIGTSTLSAGQTTITIDNIGVSITDGTEDLALLNTTAAANGAQQYSPALRLQGSGWKTDATAASQTLEFRQYVQTIQGAGQLTGNLIFESSINGGAYSEVMNIDWTGRFTVANRIQMTVNAVGGSITDGSDDLSLLNTTV